jgi:hypothetical protein
MKYVVTFQDKSRKNFLDLGSLADNLDELDALNVFTFFDCFSDDDFNQYEAIWQGDNHCEPCLIHQELTADDFQEVADWCAFA